MTEEEITEAAGEEAEQAPEARAVVPSDGARNPMSAERDEIMKKVEKATSAKELAELTDLFNMNLVKTEMARAGKQSDLMDKILEQAGSRISEGLPMDVLLVYLEAFATGLDRSKKTFNGDAQATPTMLVNHGDVNINVTDEFGLDRDSRERVMGAVKGLLSQLKAQGNGDSAQEPIDAEAREIEKGTDDDAKQ